MRLCVFQNIRIWKNLLYVTSILMVEKTMRLGHVIFMIHLLIFLVLLCEIEICQDLMDIVVRYGKIVCNGCVNVL